MKRIECLVLVVVALGALRVSAQVPVSAQLTDGTGSVATTGFLHFELQNCGNNFPVIPSNAGVSQNPWTIVRTSFDLKPNQSDGSILGQVLPNKGTNQILCGNVPSTYYVVTAMKDSSTPLSPVGGQPFVICDPGAASTEPCSNPGGTSWNPALQQPAFQPVKPGFVQIYGNPRTNQVITQPAGTDLDFFGTVDFSGATVLGLPASTGNALTIQGLAVAASGNLNKYALTWDAALNQIDWQPTGTSADAAQLQGVNICATAPVIGQALLYGGVTWCPGVISGFVPTNGGTMTGLLLLSGPPAVASGAATKGYVDGVAAAKADLVAGHVPSGELGSGSATGSTCLLGNGTWGPCGSGTGVNLLPLNNTWTATNTFNAPVTAVGPVNITSGQSMFGYTPDPICLAPPGSPFDWLCDLSGDLVWDSTGNVNQKVLLVRYFVPGSLPLGTIFASDQFGVFAPVPNTAFDPVTGNATFAGVTINGPCVGCYSASNFLSTPNTYQVGLTPAAVQTFPVDSTHSTFAFGLFSGDPCCSQNAGEAWLDSTGGTPHITFFDGNFYDAVPNFGDSACVMADGCSGTGKLVRATGASLVAPNIGDATGTSLNLQLTTGDQMDLQKGTVTPYIQATPAANHVKTGYGADNTFQMSNDGDPFKRVARQGYFLTSDFTTANNTSLQVITDGTHPLSYTKTAIASSWTFHCYMTYSQATGAAAVAFGIKALTAAPTNISASGVIWTNTTAGSDTMGAPAAITTTTSTPIVSGTPNAQNTLYRAELQGTIEDSAHVNTFQIMVSTATGADAVTVKRGSFCEFN